MEFLRASSYTGTSSSGDVKLLGGSLKTEDIVNRHVILVEDIVDILARDGYNATADFPSIVLHQEFLQRYPEARVVLTVRNSNDCRFYSVGQF